MHELTSKHRSCIFYICNWKSHPCLRNHYPIVAKVALPLKPNPYLLDHTIHMLCVYSTCIFVCVGRVSVRGPRQIDPFPAAPVHNWHSIRLDNPTSSCHTCRHRILPTSLPVATQNQRTIPKHTVVIREYTHLSTLRADFYTAYLSRFSPASFSNASKVERCRHSNTIAKTSAKAYESTMFSNIPNVYSVYAQPLLGSLLYIIMNIFASENECRKIIAMRRRTSKRERVRKKDREWSDGMAYRVRASVSMNGKAMELRVALRAITHSTNVNRFN